MRLINYHSTKPGWISILLITSIFIISCDQKNKNPNRQITPAFYYWKSVYSPGIYEMNRMRELHVETQYVKFFDVEWNQTKQQPQPVAVIRFAEGSKQVFENCRMIPVVFITNECIRHLDTLSARSFASQVLNLVRDIQTGYGFGEIEELQIDCDWTATTRDTYFAMLDQLKKLDSTLSLSATIRLHQVKQVGSTGVPPVQRGLLMCYNMGNLRDPSSTNSILDPGELKKYLGKLDVYPLPLDIALPLFEWTVLIRKGTYYGLLKLNPDELPVSVLTRIRKNRYRLLMDTTLSGFACRKDDELRYETSDIEDILQASEYLNQKWKDTNARISFFHLDSLILQKYSNHELEVVIDRFR